MKLAKDFLPISMEDLQKRKIKQLDFIIVTGDAYVDHPSFGTAIIGRTLEANGFTVGIIAQPNWHDTTDFKKLGQPKYAFLVNSGNIDSGLADPPIMLDPSQSGNVQIDPIKFRGLIDKLISFFSTL